MMVGMKDLGEFDQPVLVFGGPYGNWQATQAVLTRASELAIPAERIICTGDTVAYCGDAARTVAAIRRSGIQVVMGNCEESLGEGRPDCGCGFEEGSDCDLLSVQWFTHTRDALDDEDKQWMSRLPRLLTFTMKGRKLAVIHGGADNLSRFVFRSEPEAEKIRDLDALDVDGVIAGHCGLPFTEIIDGRLWHNAGVVGMPANDGTPRTWYSVLSQVRSWHQQFSIWTSCPKANAACAERPCRRKASFGDLCTSIASQSSEFRLIPPILTPQSSPKVRPVHHMGGSS